ncbi:MAG: RNA-binding transcriptional accessory protein [Desulfobulbus propionicus]|nr:MAG: RNA-binding transcriptional accessory protein [Desulfobulbus propionicus]
MQEHIPQIAHELRIPPRQTAAVADLLADGATIPFISRYRKEVTGGLDEVQVTQIRDKLIQVEELNKRRAAILTSLNSRELLSPELKTSIEGAGTLTELEDIYLPFKQKRKTRAVIAREKGLEPLAKSLLEKGASHLKAEDFLSPNKALHTIEEVLSGARDILAEWFNENRAARNQLRDLFAKEAVLSSRVIEKNREAGQKFKDYFDRDENVRTLPGHRLLAMLRGEQEKVLKLHFRPDEARALGILYTIFLHQQGESARQVKRAIEDSYKRLLAPSLENELKTTLKEQADTEAIEVFGTNLNELLLAPPLGERAVMALDPGFRTGAKLVCLDRHGTLLHNTTIFPTHSTKQQEQAGKTIRILCKQYNIYAIGIGNGTASRETEAFVRGLGLPGEIIITMVDESGASIYSASEIAREEFPDHDITVRGAVSIGRRLQDPLAELVKLDPQSIGVGQYQHDVNQKALKQGLDDVVVRCVNSVGVDVNTASVSLLTYVSGLGPGLAANIVAYRKENGSFLSRKQLLKVPRLGAKAFEQCAGFLRVRGGKNPLDNSAVHPERYSVVDQMARDLGCTVAELIQNSGLRKQIDVQKYVSDTVGLPTLTDILKELDKPGRDPRTTFTAFSFAEGITALTDLEPGMLLPGIVTNVTNFGAFVDIGVHQDGLVHISQLADRFVRDPNEIVSVRQHVQVRVVEVDIPRKRIGLSMKKTP